MVAVVDVYISLSPNLRKSLVLFLEKENLKNIFHLKHEGRFADKVPC